MRQTDQQPLSRHLLLAPKGKSPEPAPLLDLSKDRLHNRLAHPIDRPALDRPWEGEFFEEKEVRVYYKVINDTVMLLTVKARYGKGFPKKEASQ